MPTTWNSTGVNTIANPNVQGFINGAAAGDTITIPAGTFTWDSTVTMAGKALRLVGAGIDVTNIIDGVVNTAPMGGVNGPGALTVTASTANFMEVTGITFIASASQGHANGSLQVNGTQFDVDAFRIHHCRSICNIAATARGMTVKYVYGLVDHCNFESSGSNQMFAPHGGNAGGADGGFLPWREPLTLGSKKACYVENCTFTRVAAAGEDAIDAYAGARVVLRYNTFITCKWGFHGTDSGNQRSPVSFEIYENTIRNDSSGTLSRSGTIRGGTGVIYNNTVIENPGLVGDVSLIYYRACDRISTVLGWGFNGCDGSNYEMSTDALARTASRVASGILGGTTGAMTNAAGYAIGSSSITLQNNTGTGIISAGDYLYFGSLSSGLGATPYRVTSPATTNLPVTSGTAVINFTGSLLVAIPAVATTITDGGTKFDSATNEITGPEGGSFTRYLDSGGAFNAAGSGAGTHGYPCRDQPGVGPGQVVVPIYCWGNTGFVVASENNGPDNCQGLGVQFFMQAGRDYFPNTVHPGLGTTYIPLAFPHPLAGGSAPDTLAPAAPTGVTVS